MTVAPKNSLMFGKIAALVAAIVFAVLFTMSPLKASGRSVAIPDPAVDAPLAATSGQQTAVFAGGCFWGIQAVFQHVKGVKEATSGYSGGSVAKPGYEEVSTGTTGHAESVKITYDPSQISYGQ